MNISLHIKYQTNWGEEIRVVIDNQEFASNNLIKMNTSDGVNWNVELQNTEWNNTFYYKYIVWKDNQIVREEWSITKRQIQLSDEKNRTYKVYDIWKDLPEDAYYYSSAFTEVFLARKHESYITEKCKKGIVIKAIEPRVNKNHCLAICGNQMTLGNWNPKNALIMSDINFPEWEIELDCENITYPFEYKFIIIDKKTKELIAWEEGDNRNIQEFTQQNNEVIVMTENNINFSLSPWRGAGVAIPVFSLKSSTSFGVGDFGDIIKMVDWCVKTNQKIIQILPINDSTMTHTWKDSYPYNSISIYALHPMYANLQKMGTLIDNNKNEYFKTQQKILNKLDLLDYEAVNNIKWEYFKLIFEQESNKLFKSEDYKEFFLLNKEWLQPYAAFCYFRDHYNCANFHNWATHSIYNRYDVEKLCEENSPIYNDISIHFFIQYHLHIQLLEATNYARTNGIVLKGDIPIGISRNSVEAWTEPHYFNLNGQAGAPPDNFSIKGQNWGFPTYNWNVMAKDGYRWWIKRFKKMSDYFDAYRIDHILGFFRIWEIPMNSVYGLLGQFSPALPMTKEEVESYEFDFENQFLEPYIDECYLTQLFGTGTEEIKKTYLEPNGIWQRYQMKSNFNTQRKIEAYFNENTDNENIEIKERLYTLISNVLFVKDNINPAMYHPRINAQYTYIYQTLNEEKKIAFNHLYDEYFYKRHNGFWQEQAMKKLPQLTQCTKMLACGEDLGMIPQCVEWVMKDLRILSLEIQRMPKEYSLLFGDTNKYPYASICTFSTHDMSTLREWWQEDDILTQKYFSSILGHNDSAPKIATAELCEEVINKQLSSQSILCILSLQDWMSIDNKWRNQNFEAERINIPADSEHYWRYRMHLTIEELIDVDSLNNKIKGLIESNHRKN